jgi:hypothetical protein
VSACWAILGSIVLAAGGLALRRPASVGAPVTATASATATATAPEREAAGS